MNGEPYSLVYIAATILIRFPQMPLGYAPSTHVWTLAFVAFSPPLPSPHTVAIMGSDPSLALRAPTSLYLLDQNWRCYMYLQYGIFKYLLTLNYSPDSGVLPVSTLLWHMTRGPLESFKLQILSGTSDRVAGFWRLWEQCSRCTKGLRGDISGYYKAVLIHLPY